MTTPELALPSPSFRATPTGGRLATTYDLTCNRPHKGGSSVESGFEPATLRSEVDTLLLGHRGLSSTLEENDNKSEDGALRYERRKYSCRYFQINIFGIANL
ncbi:hypothetical protein AVEN_153219-1 [Araneus ventricosus]|uniref:Uncharacterized protein n=1 Tax=Araneus ventricosus TaxID=182803 RepID=A0A4Y2RFR0_ARAVE|nr:hypothetical protein AVEN_96805-1 [Araneus ventricosus]GBN74566.1 hypothetical protein AVEN_29664-1 [Araneus ventricosus]GBN74584.1 hypothetical protein AVEN_114361-1 [Araneus ventricosus]GBN74596.1 hypothetical protein AVEN_153219-1 [Araneus ventricosus]